MTNLMRWGLLCLILTMSGCSWFGDDEEDLEQLELERICMESAEHPIPSDIKAKLLQIRKEHSFRQFPTGIQDSLLLFIKNHATNNDPESVIRAIDTFCYSRHWMMHAGDLKLQLIRSCIVKAREYQAEMKKPLVCIEVTLLSAIEAK